MNLRALLPRVGRHDRLAVAVSAAVVGLALVFAGPARGRRPVAVCRVEGEGATLNEQMVRSGLAVAYRAFSSDYVPAEDEARIARRGLWAGTFERPDEYRVAHARK